MTRGDRALGAGLVLMAASLGGLVLGTLAEGCGATPQQVLNGEQIALNLTQAACSVADTTGDAYVVFGCALANVAENAAISITHLFVSVPAASCAAFATAHPESEASKPLVLAFKATHPGASTQPKWGVGHP